MNFVGIAHLALGLCKNIYGFIFPKSNLDMVYMSWFGAIPFTWLLCKGECLISYAWKKYENSSYQLGDQPFEHSDISDLFENKTLYEIYSHCTTFLYIGSVIIVNNRSEIVPKLLLYSTTVMLLFYIYFVNLRTHPPFQITLGYLLHRIMYYSNYQIYCLTEIFKYQINLLEQKLDKGVPHLILSSWSRFLNKH